MKNTDAMGFFVEQFLHLTQMNRVHHVIDIGSGDGRYGSAVRKTCDILGVDSPNIIGVDVDIAVKTQPELGSVYDEVIIADARWLDYREMPAKAMYVLGGVLDHMTRVEACEVITKALTDGRASCVFTAIPIVYVAQNEDNDNPYTGNTLGALTYDQVHDMFGHLGNIAVSFKGNLAGCWMIERNNNEKISA